MSDSGRQIGDCKHGISHSCCMTCKQEEIDRLNLLLGSREAPANEVEMYQKLIARYSPDQLLDMIIYWRAKWNGINAEVERDKKVIHLRKRIHSLTRKLKATREAAIEFKRGRAFDAIVNSKEVKQLKIELEKANQHGGTSCDESQQS